MPYRNSPMRITGGALHGRLIEVPKGDDPLRPAMDRMRTSVFQIIAPDLPGKSFLDLFAGTGAISLEAVSRGASRVVLCERDRSKAPCILSNVRLSEELGVRIKCRFISCERFILRNKTPFDFVFMDPPFAYAHREELLESASRNALLSEGGLLMIHYPREAPLGDRIADLVRCDIRTYGRSIMSFYRYNAGTAPAEIEING